MQRIERFEEKKYTTKRTYSNSNSPNKNTRRNDVLEVNIKESMGDYTKYSKKLYRNIDQFNARRARSAKTVVIKGIKYRF